MTVDDTPQCGAYHQDAPFGLCIEAENHESPLHTDARNISWPRYEHETCQSSDGPVRFYYDHFPTHGQGIHDHVFVSCPHHGLDPLPNDGRWAVSSVHPLTVTPSIHWVNCGCHGFITIGKWVPA